MPNTPVIYFQAASKAKLRLSSVAVESMDFPLQEPMWMTGTEEHFLKKNIG